MTTTKTLEKLYTIQAAASEHYRAAMLNEFIEELKAELLTEEAKKNGKTQAKKAAENILKQLKNTAFAIGAFTGADGLQYIGGCYSAVRLSDPLPVTPLPYNAEPVDFKKFIDAASENAGEPLNLPTIAELSAHIKEAKARKEKNIYYDFGADLPLVDARLLLDVLQVLPGCACIPSKRGVLAALYFKADNGDGLLLPVRRAQK